MAVNITPKLKIQRQSKTNSIFHLQRREPKQTQFLVCKIKKPQIANFVIFSHEYRNKYERVNEPNGRAAAVLWWWVGHRSPTGRHSRATPCVQ
ncbi:hypothetical protein HanRHA438_Chr04g0196781 [Helianthus annuus]|nr:hypothetical protein HanRHA438_Chr04g0196781 [Helianthus annuus]